MTPDIEVRRGDVLSAWAGIRPLVKDPNKEDTQNLVRNHVIHVSPSGLITIAGGKWTTYRSMAVETLDRAVQELNLPAKNASLTDGMYLEGGHTWTPTQFIRLVQDIGVDSDVAKHLSETYGDRAFSVVKMCSLTGQRWPIAGKRLHDEYPYIEAEVKYACRVEMAATAVDIIARRLRLSFLNVQAAEEALPRIVDIMGEELKWSKAEKAKQQETALEFLKKEMGKNVNKEMREKIPINLTQAEIREYVKRFNALDGDKKGFVSVNDIRESLKVSVKVDIERFDYVLRYDMDLSLQGAMTLEEFIQVIFFFSTSFSFLFCRNSVNTFRARRCISQF